MRYLIYGLRDPRTLEIRYVGQSTTVFKRPRSHKNKESLEEKNRKANWIKSLIFLGLMYEIVVLEISDYFESLNEAECRWISIGRSALGERLTNTTPGGDSRSGWRHSEEVKKKMSVTRKGRRHTSETKAKMSAAQKGHPGNHNPKSASTRARMLIAARVRAKDRKTVAKIAASHLGRNLSEDHKRAISESHKRSEKNTLAIKSVWARLSPEQRRLRMTPVWEARKIARERQISVREEGTSETTASRTIGQKRKTNHVGPHQWRDNSSSSYSGASGY